MKGQRQGVLAHVIDDTYAYDTSEYHSR